MMRVVVATRSAHKVREILQILSDLPGLDLVDLDAAGVPEIAAEEGVEAFDTFADNALAKARHFAARAGALVLADDSGLCVDALGGAPGVYSKRFAGRTDLSGEALDRCNNELLLSRMEQVPDAKRQAHYVCAVALVDPAGWEAVVEGTCEGVILREPRGSGGFGYDPLFFVPEEGATFAEIPAERKNQISHRARAVRRAAELLERRRQEAPPGGTGAEKLFPPPVDKDGRSH